jgi:succinoglycan biosynthesis protein ExoM
MPASVRVDVCVCTYRRQSVVDTLRSIAAQRVPDGTAFRVIVADNDETPSARALVLQAADALGLACRYVHAPARNISIARNAALAAADAPLIAFIDDDEIATPAWIAELIARRRQTAATVVLGPVKALYGEGPRWLREADLHSVKPALRAGGTIDTGYSGNALIDRGAMTAAMRALRFDLALGRSGGEDSAFFSRLHRLGARIVYAPDALVHETIPPQRGALGWLLKRSFRAGQSHARTLVETRRCKPCLMAVAIAKCGFCAAGTIGRALSPPRWRAYAVRTALHAGVVSRLAGMGELKLY